MRERWGPKNRGTLKIETPRTVIDRHGRIIMWALPDVILPRFQVSLIPINKEMTQRVVSAATVLSNKVSGG